MGNTTKKQFLMSPNDWQSVAANYGRQQIQVWRNRKSGEEFEEYRYVSHSASDLKRLTNLYLFRENHRYLVSTKQFRDSTGDNSKEPYQLVSMFLERIPRRLSQVEQVGFSDALHIYDSSLNGFRTLFEKVGPFAIQEDMIGFSRQGRVKVWFHSDFSRDHPDSATAGFVQTEKQMVAQLIQILERKVDRAAPENISLFLANSQTFEQALAKLVVLAKRHSVKIPERLKIRFDNTSPVKESLIVDNGVGLKDLKSQLGSLIQNPIEGSSVVSTNSSKIKSIQTKTILANGVTLDPRVPAHRLFSHDPILGQTPIGIRPLSPARIVIRAESPIPRGQSALEIRPMTPPSGIHATLHPLLLQPYPQIQSSFINPKAASTLVRPVAPFIRPVESAVLSQASLPVQQEDLRSLQRRMQSQLERVNAVIRSMHEGNATPRTGNQSGMLITTTHQTAPQIISRPPLNLQENPITYTPQVVSTSSTPQPQPVLAPLPPITTPLENYTLPVSKETSAQKSYAPLKMQEIYVPLKIQENYTSSNAAPTKIQSKPLENYAPTVIPSATYQKKQSPYKEMASERKAEPSKTEQITVEPFYKVSQPQSETISYRYEPPKIQQYSAKIEENNRPISFGDKAPVSSFVEGPKIINQSYDVMDTNKPFDNRPSYQTNYSTQNSQTVNSTTQAATYRISSDYSLSQSKNAGTSSLQSSYEPITTDSKTLKFDRNSNYIKVQARKIESS